MKKIPVLMLCVLSYGMLSAQTAESKRSVFQLSFVPPLSTNGQEASQYTNKVSFNILGGISQNEEIFTFGGLSNIVKNDARGFQFAGLSNHIGNSGKGFQFAGLANVNKNEFKGSQFSGLTNIAKSVKGFQFAGLSNHTGNDGHGAQFAGLANVNKNKFKGFQFAGVLNTTSDMKGFQFSGLTNIAKSVKGFQFAGLSNHTRNDGYGFQFAGLANVNKNKFKGFQFAGVLNTVSDMKGLQFSGLTNIAKSVKGVQFAGLINIAKNVKGVQFAGLINIAENSDCPIGLINIIKNGEKSVAITYDAIGNTVVSFRSGGKYTYGILGVGYNHKTKGNSFVTEGGLGAHIPILSWFRINNEIKVSSIGSDSSEPVLNGGYSLIPAFKIGNHFELLAGASINYMASKDIDNDKIFPGHSLWKRHNSTKLQQLYIGYQFGFQYIF